jgi:hypothetical protein
MNILLNWTPGVGSTAQDVQYKLSTASTWTTHQTVSGAVNNVTINGLQDNLIYDFRILTECSTGAPAPSTPTQQINIICPVITIVSTSDTTISYSFPELGGSVTAYVVKLFNAAGTVEVGSETPTGTTTRSGTFAGLTENTTYNIRVLITAGTFSKNNCAFTSATTTDVGL